MNQYERGGFLKYSDTKYHRPHPSCCAIDFLCNCIGIFLSSHGKPIETFLSQKYLHLIFPFEEIEWSHDDPLRLVHILAPVPFSQQNVLPVNNVEPVIMIWKDKNQSIKALIPCGN